MKNLRYFVFSLLIYMSELSGVTSKNIPVAPEAEKFPYCPSVEFLSKSNVTIQCGHEPKDLLCLVLQDLSKKWCLKRSLNGRLPEVANATQFESYVSKFETIGNVENFCKTLKNFSNTNRSDFDAFECLRQCLDPATGNKEPKKLCSVLAWFQSSINSIDEKVPVPGPGIIDGAAGKAPGAEGIQKKNKGEKSKEQNKSIADGTEKATLAKNTKLKSENEQADISKPPLKHDDQKKFQEGPVNHMKIPEEQSISDANNANSNKQIPKKNDQSAVLPDPVDKQESPVTEKIVEGISGAENIGNNPDTNISPGASAPEMGKKTETSIEMTEKVLKPVETKSSTISDNTNDLIDSTLPRDDVDIPLGDNDDDQIGQSNPEPEFVNEMRKIPRLPGRETDDESHIFSYFVVLSLMVVCCFIGYHNKKKILGLLLEGRRSRSGRNRRRPSTANYRKLDCNLEEAVTSQCNSNVTHVIY